MTLQHCPYLVRQGMELDPSVEALGVLAEDDQVYVIAVIEWIAFERFAGAQIDVEVGQRVEAGDQIALVGDTGLSTGAHLHWDFWVNGTNVSALQWTEHRFP